MIINYKDMPDNFCNVSSDDIIELEPCPFCGSGAYLNYDARRRNYGHCGMCGADGGGHWDENEAIKLWNNRAYSKEKMTEKEALLGKLAKEDLQVLALAYIYAKNLHMYGEDVTKNICSATQNAAMLDKAYRRGYYDAMNKKIEESEMS